MVEYTTDNPLTGEPVTGTLGRILAERENEVALVEWTPEGWPHPVSIVQYHVTGLEFTPQDWDGPQAETLEDIADVPWIDWMGRPAIMLDGWPVMLG